MKLVSPSEISGAIPAPPSKSMMIRAQAAALLSTGITRISNPSSCADALAAQGIISALGAVYKKQEQDHLITGGIKSAADELNCGESGLCMRLFTPVAALFDKPVTLTGEGSLRHRLMQDMEVPLQDMGAFCETDNGFPPIKLKGPLKAGRYTLDASLSSQFLTGLLYALPLCDSDSELTARNLRSKPYVAMTLSMLARFDISILAEKDFTHLYIPGGQKYNPAAYRVEGDWSGAAFMLVAGALRGEIEVRDLLPDSQQADKQILDALSSAGADISSSGSSLRVKQGKLQAFEFDATDCPDLFPPLTALACGCEGTSTLYGTDRLEYKESPRGRVLLQEFKKIGAEIAIKENHMEIKGSRLHGGIIDSHNDHRIAMAGAVAGLIATDGVKIRNWQAVTKSYPDFFNDLKAVGGGVK